jgi:membrane associated rhomboid family serine protease
MATYHGYNPDFRESWLTPPSPIIARLLILNAAIFVLQVLIWVAAGPEGHRLWVSRIFALSSDGLRSFMVWQVITYMFLHAPTDILHILFNSLFLWMFGRDVEYELGPRRFLWLYLAGGVFGGLLWVTFNMHSPIPVLGASAAVWAVCIAFATIWPDRPITLFFILTMRAKYWAMIALAIAVYYTLMHSSLVAHLAHLGGMVFGFLYIKWCGYGRMPLWMALLQRLLGGGRKRRPSPNDEFHSSRPGVPYNHPYRSLDEETENRPAPKRGVLSRMLSPRPRPAEPEDLDKDEYIRREIDPILDKIAKHGMQSLTRRERAILESARDKIDKNR